MNKKPKDERKAIEILKRGGIGVMPTDTIYGLVGSALQPDTVEKIYAARERDKKKPLIILISDQLDLLLFGIIPNQQMKKLIDRFWTDQPTVKKIAAPPTTIIFPCPLRGLKYLHRGQKTLAVRRPRDQWLRDFLRATGPLAAPSANPAGQPPAATIVEAKKYFGDKIDFYLDGGILKGKSSTIIGLKNDKIKIVRA